jgi:hypothetical protein
MTTKEEKLHYITRRERKPSTEPFTWFIVWVLITHFSDMNQQRVFLPGQDVILCAGSSPVLPETHSHLVE